MSFKSFVRSRDTLIKNGLEDNSENFEFVHLVIRGINSQVKIFGKLPSSFEGFCEDSFERTSEGSRFYAD